ncbi:hypothetical protein TNCV_4885721 [Trichonephila clavipes]|uniref:Uncharacterized protein n=1 Tax=Trichonephila clavipes TaxID=2585209 RepID=A0A8X6RQD5_TRICX|nr:hypothetical protein TNCV_4885721 [Trichonephila clavipes]
MLSLFGQLCPCGQVGSCVSAEDGVRKLPNGWSLILHSPSHLTGTFRSPPEVSVWTSHQRWLAYRADVFLLGLKISVIVGEDFT